MPFLAVVLTKLVGILGPIVAQIGWSLMTERLIRTVCAITVEWIRDTWFEQKDHPHAYEIFTLCAGYIRPPAPVKELPK